MSHRHPHHPAGGLDAQPVVADASVRLARPTDAPAVGLVQALLWREAYAALLPAEVVDGFQPQPFASVWRVSLESPPSAAYRLLVACAGEQVVGLAAIGPSADPDAADTDGELLVLGVHPQARHAGHGSRLLNAAVDTARGAGFTTLHGWLLETDEATRAFLWAGGLEADGAYRDRVVGPSDGDVARELRVAGAID